MIPHVAAPKAYQRLSEFLLATPKRLLQQNLPIADMPIMMILLARYGSPGNRLGR